MLVPTHEQSTSICKYSGGSLQQHVRMGGLLYGDIAKAVPLPNDETGERWDELRLDIYMKRIYGDNGVPVAPLTPMESTELLGKVSEEMAEEIRETEKAAVTKSMRSSPTVIARRHLELSLPIRLKSKTLVSAPTSMKRRNSSRIAGGDVDSRPTPERIRLVVCVAQLVTGPSWPCCQTRPEDRGSQSRKGRRPYRVLDAGVPPTARLAEHCERLRLNFWRLQSEIPTDQSSAGTGHGWQVRRHHIEPQGFPHGRADIPPSRHRSASPAPSSITTSSVSGSNARLGTSTMWANISSESRNGNRRMPTL